MSDIAELFARDPLSLTKDDRSKIIAYFREKRAAFQSGQKQAGSTKEMRRLDLKAVPLPSLKDLGLEE